MAEALHRTLGAVDSRIQQRARQAARAARGETVPEPKTSNAPVGIPSKPKGHDAATLAWARQNIANPEAAAIMAHHSDWLAWRRRENDRPYGATIHPITTTGEVK